MRKSSIKIASFLGSDYNPEPANYGDSAVGIETGYRLDDRGVGVPQHFYPFHDAQTCYGAHSASYPMVPGALSTGVRRPVREADHSNYVWGQEYIIIIIIY
jgi:hypothetical protein